MINMLPPPLKALTVPTFFLVTVDPLPAANGAVARLSAFD